MNPSLIFWGLMFGSIGLGFFVYGKKQGAIVPLVCGLAMMAVPYLVSNTVLLVVLGAALVAVPFLVRL